MIQVAIKRCRCRDDNKTMVMIRIGRVRMGGMDVGRRTPHWKPIPRPHPTPERGRETETETEAQTERKTGVRLWRQGGHIARDAVLNAKEVYS